ncbi:WXG100 family type VII secretion target [Stackebrandtia nassauensis]|uniref:Outer membrane channel protein CpnT-like N-terminal domain-containing protein n=1 Tax=Stackebrandtia nassauensis (strain DSM 44728 / CIP 108903 / NRRL B-16338 / NBRC 102104 / LLR-40K-21) TaxID=446470 RepID=D3PXW3_STANL|nr:hypothetical protein [Stackebrandtia nassauensis]ADD45292.1 hypothetical protein Snas_5662 [Stackebrandtia nassauensis DSM 44728]
MNDNPLIADVDESTTGTSGLWLVEDTQLLIDAIESGSWVDGVIGGITVGLDVLSAVLDPLGALVSMAIGWLIEHIKPLRDALEKVTGDADKVRSYAKTWDNVSAKLVGAGTDLQSAVHKDLETWQSPAANAYSIHADYTTNAVGGVGALAGVLAAATEGAGMLVATTRAIVRDLIAECVTTLLVRIPLWLAEIGLTLGLGTGWVIAQVDSLIAKWVARITSYLNSLVASLSNLQALLA